MSALRSGYSPDIPALVDELDRDGFVCLSDVIDPQWLADAQGEVTELLDEHGQRFFSIIRPADKAGSAADRLVHDPLIAGLMRDLTRAACPQGIVDYEDIYNVMRVIAGPDGTNGSLEFHYDASVVTMLAPVFMPSDKVEGSGALVTLPNHRPFRSSVVTNLVEKAVTQNRFYRSRVAKKVLSRPEDFAQVLMPGNLYLFWGYRTYHGNLACAPNSTRATILLHYGNPHGNSPLLHAIRNTRKQVESARLGAK